jgi:NitT/TauT family transport system ATP-binding protein
MSGEQAQNPTAASSAPAIEPGPVIESKPTSASTAAEALPPVVQLIGVSKRFTRNGRSFNAIENVNFQVEDHPERGEFISILGPSGCGKSTVIRLIAGLTPQHPSSTGQVLVFGKPVLGPGADRGMVFQDYTSFDHLTVWQNVAFGLKLRGVPEEARRATALEWIDKVGLNRSRDADKYPHELSGGMRQRVAIARTLVLKPRIILMDEPFGALDPGTRASMQELLKSLWAEQQASVFFITHAMDEALYLSDRTLIFSKAPGTIAHDLNLPRFDKPVSEVLRDSAFLDAVHQVRTLMHELEK